VAILEEKEIFLHFSRSRRADSATQEQGEFLKYFWVLEDMMDFENIGFTHADAGGAYKYLTCADCETPCLGLQFLKEGDPKKLYLTASTKRITYE